MPEESLVPLGFTPNESAVYVQLVRGGSQTGYAVAKALGKPAAQVYAVLESLKQKSAVLGGANDPRVWKAVERDVLLGQLEQSFAARREHAESLLRQLERDSPDEEVFRLSTAEQVWSRTRVMLAAATSSAVLDCFPGPLRMLLDDIEEAAARGVSIGVIRYEPEPTPRGTETSRSPTAGEVQKAIPGAILQCAVDGLQYLAALFAPSGELQTGFWTESLLVAGLGHNGLATEFGYTRLAALAEAGASAEELRDVQRAVAPLLWRATPGFRALGTIDPLHTPPSW